MPQDVILKFNNVGRRKFSEQVKITLTQYSKTKKLSADDIAEIAVRTVKRLKLLMSRNIEVVYDPETSEGGIYAGHHKVGTFNRITEESST